MPSIRSFKHKLEKTIPTVAGAAGNLASNLVSHNSYLYALYSLDAHTEEVDFGDGVKVTPENDNCEIFVVKYTYKLKAIEVFALDAAMGATNAIGHLAVNDSGVYFTALIQFPDEANPSLKLGNGVVVKGITNDQTKIIVRLSHGLKILRATTFFESVTPEDDHICRLALDDKNVYVAGAFGGAADFGVDFGNDVKLSTGTNNHKFYIVKYNHKLEAQDFVVSETGDFNIANQFDIVVNSCHIYLASHSPTAGNMDFGNGVDVTTTEDESAFIVQYDKRSLKARKIIVHDFDSDSSTSIQLAINNHALYVAYTIEVDETNDAELDLGNGVILVPNRNATNNTLIAKYDFDLEAHKGILASRSQTAATEQMTLNAMVVTNSGVYIAGTVQATGVNTVHDFGRKCLVKPGAAANNVRPVLLKYSNQLEACKVHVFSEGDVINGITNSLAVTNCSIFTASDVQAGTNTGRLHKYSLSRTFRTKTLD